MRLTEQLAMDAEIFPGPQKPADPHRNGANAELDGGRLRVLVESDVIVGGAD